MNNLREKGSVLSNDSNNSNDYEVDLKSPNLKQGTQGT